MRFHVTRRTPTSVGLLSLLLVGALAAKAVAAQSACFKSGGGSSCGGRIFVNMPSGQQFMPGPTDTADSFTLSTALSASEAAPFTPGEVFTLSSGDLYASGTKGVVDGCTIVPGSNGYAPDCVPDQGPSGAPTYTAVSFLGSQNNPNANFAVGDDDGNLYLANLVFDQTTGDLLTVGVTKVKSASLGWCDGAIWNLETDPAGDFLYVGCNVGTFMGQFGNVGSTAVPMYDLYSIPIASDGSLGDPSLQFSGYWWMGVSPVIRAYPGDAPGLVGSKYSSLNGGSGSGAVMVSGILSGVEATNPYGGPNDVPKNVGVMCSQGICEQSWEHTLAGSNSISVVTAAELGQAECSYSAGSNSTTCTPALFWTQVQAKWGTMCGEWFYEQYFCDRNTVPYVDALTASTAGDGAKPGLVQCILEPGTFECKSTTSVPLPSNWPTTAGATNLLFMPYPGGGIASSFTGGLLTLGVMNVGDDTGGAIATFDPLGGNLVGFWTPAPGTSGALPNVVSMQGDGNGNLLVGTGGAGLFLFSPFNGQNFGDNAESMTLIKDTEPSSPPQSSNIAGVAHVAFHVVTSAAELLASPPTLGDGELQRFDGRAKQVGDAGKGSVKIEARFDSSWLKKLDLSSLPSVWLDLLLDEDGRPLLSVDGAGACQVHPGSPCPIDLAKTPLAARRGARRDAVTYQFPGRDPSGAKVQIEVRDGVAKVEAKISRASLATPAACSLGASSASLVVRLRFTTSAVPGPSNPPATGALEMKVTVPWQCKPARCSGGGSKCFELRSPVG